MLTAFVSAHSLCDDCRYLFVVVVYILFRIIIVYIDIGRNKIRMGTQIRIKEFYKHKLPACRALARSWLASEKAEWYCYPFYSRIQLLMIVSFALPVFLVPLFFFDKIQMAFRMPLYACVLYVF